MNILGPSMLCPLLLSACGSPPDLRANWYAVPAVQAQTASAPGSAPPPPGYAPLKTSNRLLLAMLNRDERPVTILCVEVNPPPEDHGSDAERCKQGDPTTPPWRGNVLPKEIRLVSGESLLVDLTSRPATDAGTKTRGPCHVPVRLRLMVQQPDRWGHDKPYGRAVVITIPDPMPSAVPEDWELHCIEQPKKARDATP